jgi:hypothetical protein
LKKAGQAVLGIDYKLFKTAPGTAGAPSLTTFRRKPPSPLFSLIFAMTMTP